MDERQLNEILQNGIKAARRGHKEPARKLLSQVVQVDANNEEAWLWLSRVADDPQQQAQCLQQVLQVNPDNRWAAGQLAELQSPPPVSGQEAPPPLPAEPAAPAQPSADESSSKYKRIEPKSSELKLETLSCPHCGGTVDLRSGAEAKTMVCNHCGSVLDLTSEQAAVIGQMNKRVRPTMPIKPGMTGSNSRRYDVV